MTHIIDAHQHIWTLARAEYAWMDHADRMLHRDHEIGEAIAELDAAGVDGTVLVQSADNVEDSRVMFEAARACQRVRGVVAWVPLDDPAEAENLLGTWAREPSFCGIRNLIHTRDDSSWLASPAVDVVLGILEDRGLPLDVVAVDSDHLRAAVAVGERHPRLRMVIDHLGHPPIKGRADGDWSRLIAEVAANPLTHAKVSGLYPVAGAMDDWNLDDLRPWIERSLGLFGPDRLMYGGDWPISRLAGGYARVWSTLSTLIGAWDEASRARVLGGTAIDFYRLTASAHAWPGASKMDAGDPAERSER